MNLVRGLVSMAIMTRLTRWFRAGLLLKLVREWW
jgi:hypothetical protein